ncbi:MAG TPA: hypothetical protein VGP82_03890, partial [Ktedonobacterales bacterium]|nr:hypothetical protein [Ktedonobacterales bacterium]
MAASTANAANEQRTVGGPHGTHRWWIAVLLATGIVINYFDRFNISVATKPLSQEFHLSNTEIGIIL